MAWENRPNPQGYAKNWTTIRRRVLERSLRVCALEYDGCTKVANEVDHINGDIENNNPDNLRALCYECHKKVTIQNQKDSRNLMDPRPAPKHMGQLVEELPEKKVEEVDDLPSENPEDWIITYGPVFSKKKGRYRMPKKTLGPIIALWVMQNLQIKGQPFKFTAEQYRILCWMYALSPDGRWLYNKTLHIAPKGWGKDPFGAVLCAVELAGGCRFSHWDEKGNPVAKRQEGAWVQIAAVSLSQNDNTLIYLKGIFTPEAAQRYQIEEQAETIYAFGRKSKIHSIASSSNSLEGNFPTFVMMSELQHWFSSNKCDKLYDVLTRNLTKVSNSHSYLTTNAYNPNESSQAQKLHEKWLDSEAGLFKKSKLLMVMKGATMKAPRETIAQRMKVLKKVYGSSTAYTDVLPFAESFDDNTAGSAIDNQESLRFYYNTVGVESSSFIDIRDWDQCRNWKYDPAKGLLKGTKLVLALDCSKNDDDTALVGCVVEGPMAGTLKVFGVWSKPRHLRGEERDNWKVPREEVAARVDDVFKFYNVRGFWADPSHKMDENGGGSYWRPLLDELHRKYSGRIPPSMWAKGQEHSILWDMASHANQRTFVDGLAAFEQEITDKTIKHDGDTDLRRHLQNARRFKSKRFGSTIAKPSPRSPQKIDLAVTACIAYIMYAKLSTNRKTTTNQMKGRYSVPESR